MDNTLPAVELCQAERHVIVHSNVGVAGGQIEGATIKSLTAWHDDRGFFAEIFRDNEEVVEGFEVRQTSLTLTRPGTIKAFHYHRKQDDVFCCLVGAIRIALIDLRKDSPTRGVANSIFCGDRSLKAVRIPAGVAHGYEVLGTEDMQMVYYTNQYYDPEDEYRFAFDDPALGFTWWGVENR